MPGPSSESGAPDVGDGRSRPPARASDSGDVPFTPVKRPVTRTAQAPTRSARDPDPAAQARPSTSRRGSGAAPAAKSPADKPARAQRAPAKKTPAKKTAAKKAPSKKAAVLAPALGLSEDEVLQADTDKD